MVISDDSVKMLYKMKVNLDNGKREVLALPKSSELKDIVKVNPNKQNVVVTLPRRKYPQTGNFPPHGYVYVLQPYFLQAKNTPVTNTTKT